jgi:hypothetical protein
MLTDLQKILKFVEVISVECRTTTVVSNKTLPLLTPLLKPT